jgi:tRNA/rRNA methyltransferase
LRLAYLGVSGGAGASTGSGGRGTEGQGATAGSLAPSDDIEGMYTHLENALVALEFLDPANPKKLMSRLRRLFARSGLEREEVNIVRGIAKHILLKVEHTGDGTP